jgi:hypothetical protein
VNPRVRLTPREPRAPSSAERAQRIRYAVGNTLTALALIVVVLVLLHAIGHPKVG